MDDEAPAQGSTNAARTQVIKDRLYRGSILVEWANIYRDPVSVGRAFQAIAYELIDLEIGMLDEESEQILRKATDHDD